MKVSFEIPDTISISLRDGSSVVIETAALHTNALPYAFVYGLKQCVADAASSADNATEGQEMLEAKVEALYSGDIRIASDRTGDPVLRELLAIVQPKVRAKFKADGFNVTKPKEDGYVKPSVIREKSIAWAGDRDNPPNESAAKAWALARKRVEESAFEL